MSAPTFTATDKLAAVRREIAYRKHVYPRLVAKGRLTQATADREAAIMQAIAEDYDALAAKERLL